MGSISNKVGKGFEKDFRNSCPKDVLIFRLKDGKGVGKNPCDYIVYKYPHMYMLELKTVQGKSLPFVNIKPHQLESMNKVWEVYGMVGGFIINFRSVNETYFVDGRKMKSFTETTDKKSFPISWVKDNGILLPQHIKRTRYHYDYSFMQEVYNYDTITDCRRNI